MTTSITPGRRLTILRQSVRVFAACLTFSFLVLEIIEAKKNGFDWGTAVYLFFMGMVAVLIPSALIFFGYLFLSWQICRRINDHSVRAFTQSFCSIFFFCGVVFFDWLLTKESFSDFSHYVRTSYYYFIFAGVTIVGVTLFLSRTRSKGKI